MASSGSNSSKNNIDSMIAGQTLVSVEDAMALYHNNIKVVKFVDGSWFLGNDRNAKQEYVEGPRIEGARFLDIDEIATPTEDKLPHMMPSPKVFAATMDAYDISNDDHVVVYGSQDCMFVARGYWQLRTMGHQNCHLLDGSLYDWIQAGGPVEPQGTPPKFPVMDYETAMNAVNEKKSFRYQATDPQNIVDIDELKRLIETGKTKTAKGDDNDNDKVTIVDVRSPARYKAEVDEPRPGLRLGHMPGAVNLFFLDLLDPQKALLIRMRDSSPLHRRQRKDEYTN